VFGWMVSFTAFPDPCIFCVPYPARLCHAYQCEKIELGLCVFFGPFGSFCTFFWLSDIALGHLIDNARFMLDGTLQLSKTGYFWEMLRRRGSRFLIFHSSGKPIPLCVLAFAVESNCWGRSGIIQPLSSNEIQIANLTSQAAVTHSAKSLWNQLIRKQITATRTFSPNQRHGDPTRCYLCHCGFRRVWPVHGLLASAHLPRRPCVSD